MKRDKSTTNGNGIPAVAIFRGVYNRVAVKLGVDPSYVSRVARGERNSPAVVAALEEEMSLIRDQLNSHLAKSKKNGKTSSAPAPQETSPAD
jgi:DNA-binding transcriptional regulator YdaS (Cro superfamily)